MGIQRCKNCGNKFSYMDVLDSVGWAYRPLICKECGARHKLKSIYIFTIIVLLILPMVFINQIGSLELSALLRMEVFLLYIVYIGAMVGIYPFIVRYKLYNEKV